MSTSTGNISVKSALRVLSDAVRLSAKLNHMKTSELRERFLMNQGVEVSQLHCLVFGSPSHNDSLSDMIMRMHYNGSLYGIFDFLDEEELSAIIADEGWSLQFVQYVITQLEQNDCLGFLAEVRIPYMMNFKPYGNGYHHQIAYGRQQVKYLFAADLEDLVDQIDHQYEVMKLKCLEAEGKGHLAE